MTSIEGFYLSPRTLQLHTDSTSSSSSSSSPDSAERERQGFATPKRAVSSTSSQGSWVIDPEDGGWHGLGSSTPPSSRTRQPQRQHDHQHDESGRSRQVSPSASASSLHSWARLPLSPQSSLGSAVGMMSAGTKAAEYPAIGSPARSPGGARTGGGCGRTAGDGLVGLAREEMSCDFDVKIYTLPTASPPVDPVSAPPSGARANQRGRGDEDDEASALVEATGRTEMGPTETTREIGDVDGDDVSTVNISASDGAGVATDAVRALPAGDETSGSIPAGLENVVHAPPLRETKVAADAPLPQLEAEVAADAPLPQLEAEVAVDTTATVAPSRASVGADPRSVPSTNTPSSGDQEETSHPSHNPVRCPSLENAGAETLARDGPRSAVAPSASLTSAEDAGTPVAAAAPARVDAVGEVDGDGDCDGDVDVDGRQLDRLWRWTGLLTAARMGVIPMIVCVTVAALSCQSGGAGEGQGSGTDIGGRGGGGGAGGGNGGTRTGELRRGVGGGGAGCFPACGERHPYGFPSMPFCAAPCFLTVF